MISAPRVRSSKKPTFRISVPVKGPLRTKLRKFMAVSRVDKLVVLIVIPYYVDFQTENASFLHYGSTTCV